MLDKSLRLTCRLPGGIVVGDKSLIRPDQDLAAALGVTLDIEGETDLAAQFAAPWQQTWAEAAESVKDAGRKGRFVLQLVRPGVYYVRLTDQPVPEIERAAGRREAVLEVPSGVIAVAEASDLAAAVTLARSPRQLSEVGEVPAGPLCVTVIEMRPRDEAEVVLGQYWSPKEPCLVFQIRRAIPAESPENVFLSRPELPRTMLRQAVVEKVEGSRAELRLQEAPGLYSGTVSMDIHQRFSVGARLVIRVAPNGVASVVRPWSA